METGAAFEDQTLAQGLQDAISRVTAVARIHGRLYRSADWIGRKYNIGNFHRCFSLSNKVDASNIQTEMRDGLLTVTIPKAEEAKAQRIEVS
jgi:HSP20 family molecular chaperone IbpA